MDTACQQDHSDFLSSLDQLLPCRMSKDNIPNVNHFSWQFSSLFYVPYQVSNLRLLCCHYRAAQKSFHSFRILSTCVYVQLLMDLKEKEQNSNVTFAYVKLLRCANQLRISTCGRAGRGICSCNLTELLKRNSMGADNFNDADRVRVKKKKKVCD